MYIPRSEIEALRAETVAEIENGEQKPDAPSPNGGDGKAAPPNPPPPDSGATSPPSPDCGATSEGQEDQPGEIEGGAAEAA